MPRFFLSIIAAVLFVGSLGVVTSPARAGGCFEDPIFERTMTAKVIVGARVRDVACMEGSVVLTTLAVGATIAVTGETDGWYRVRIADGRVGWVGQQLLSITNSSVLPEPSSTTEVVVPRTGTLSTSAKSALRERLKGFILLQVEQRGEAWYVHPIDGRRFYLKDGPTAYQMMRSFGLGITNDDLDRLRAGNADLKRRLKGRILLQVQAHGEAWYVHPESGEAFYMKDGASAYDLMRAKSLGITDADLSVVTEGELSQ